MATLEAKASPGGESTLKDSESQQQPGKKSEQPAHGLLTRLPPWVTEPLKSPRAWKVFLRSWVAVFASFVILLPNASLRVVGTTSFFSIITALFLPPYFPMQLTIFLLSTLMVGLCMGWGIGLGAMRAANAVRDQAAIQAVAAQIQTSIQANPVFQANPALAQTTAIFAGWFLDTRATVIYGVFLAVGSFIFGLIRAYAPKLLFMSIFGTIAVDIFCSIGPLFPTKRYTLLNSTAISIACYMGIAIVTTLLVFPETMSHSVMDSLAAQLARIQALVAIQDDVLQARAEELAAPGAPLIERFKKLRARVISTQQQLVASSGFLSLEFSWGRWNGDDLRDLEEPTVALITRVSCLLNFDRLAGTARLPAPNSSSASLSAGSLADPRWHETHLLRAVHTKHAALEAAHGVRPADILPLLDSATRPLRSATTSALGTLKDEIVHVNHTRWRRGASGEERAVKLQEAAAQLRAALEAFNAEGRMELLAPFLPLLDAAAASGVDLDNASEEELPLRSLFVAYVFVANLVAVADAVLGLVGAVQAIDSKRPRKARLWAPTGVRSIWKLVTARGDKADGAFGEDTSPPMKPMASAGRGGEAEYRKDPDSRPPTNALQRLMHVIHKVYLWTGTAEAVFTFKYVIVSIALWLPAIFRNSAHIYYVEKGVWALIMAQTTMNIYAADQIYNYVTRLGGTLLGLVLGLIAWYAGNGTGSGNPYGAAAAFGVVSIPLVFLRVFSPEHLLAGNVMCCATFALVVGYSWVDGNTVQFASPGLGWSVAWRRWTLVAIGSAASFIVMMFPPKSGRKAVRQRNAASIASLASVYGFLVSAWIGSRDDQDEESADVKREHENQHEHDELEEVKDQKRTLPATVTPAWTAEFRARLMVFAEEMHTIRELTDLARWEGSIRGKWPAAQYMQLVDIQADMVASLAQLGSSLGYLEKEWRLTFLHSSKVLNPHFIADVMAVFALISQSLRTGEPMHQVVPSSLLDRLFYHDAAHQPRSPVVAVDATGRRGKVVDVAGIKSLSYMYYASSVVAVYQLLRSLDELHRITKDLCGEIPLGGFADWRDEYDRTHAAV
ncbi:hypothetical protein C8R43DRAFT_1064102 [Mycena crocata]|nr:hypothetical protein C8R43DRAFT_1064102 [Mycena crocata]